MKKTSDTLWSQTVSAGIQDQVSLILHFSESSFS